MTVVSVIVPTFNGAATIVEALQSVRAQSMPVEIIVVDDGSTDDTPSILRDLGVLAIRQENAGPAAARNTGLAHATTPLVAFIDDDDIWMPRRLQTQLAILEAHPEALATIGYSSFVACDVNGDAMGEPTEPHLFANMGAALVRREAFDRIGAFDPTLAGSEDVDWYLRLRDAGLGPLITRDLVQLVRRTGDNMTRGKDLRELDMHTVLHRSIARRRKVNA
jgi:glycosyltransferase involved in cell wall biosynthesis